MSMPILPGLMGTDSPQAPPVGLAFDDLTNEEMAALVSMAAVPDETLGAESMPDDDAGKDHDMEEQHADENGAGAPAPEGASLPPGIELTEEQQAQIQAQEIANVAQVCAADCAMAMEQLAGMLEQAEAADDGDPKAIKKLIKEAEKLKADCDKALEKVISAAEDGNADKATEFAAECEEASNGVQELLAQAQAVIDAQAPAMVPAGSEAAAGAPAGAPAAPPAPAAHPLATWAKS